MTAATIKSTPTLLQQQADWLQQYQLGIRIAEQGNILSVGDGIAWISGLPSAALDDIILFDDGSRGVVFDLSPSEVGVVLLNETDALVAGTPAHLARHSLGIGAGDELLGRVIDPLGVPLDGLPAAQHTVWQPLENPSPPITAREFVNEPLYTGIKIIDTIIPVGKGQRQLIIGDEGLGRSAIAIDAVINQLGRDVYCIYVLIGQKRSNVVTTIETLKNAGALAYTTVVVAEASSLPGLKHLAPSAGCALAEHWMQQGKDTLVIYDDLSTHAKNYRELSLLLRRPPGREAYPGDIFSVHARLLERATCLNAGHGGGSMTALPIVETQQGEIAAYIPTNLISITDGQIYLDHSLFVAGFRPAIDIARSVSRVGGQAQHKRIKEESGRIKLTYLQFLELEVFTRFGAHLEQKMERSIQRGKLLRELLKQDRLSPLSETVQLAWLIGFNDGYFDELDLDQVQQAFETLVQNVNKSSYDLDTPRQTWSDEIAGWLSSKPETSSA